MPGRLVLVATPIGNLGDITPRALDALRSADVVACEDTRRTGKLLELTGVGHRKMLVLNEHTETARSAEVLALVAAGSTVAVVTDAGTPGISDPGERLVRAAVEAGVTVTTTPGPSAVIAALVVSGLPTARFVMEGFLPRKGSERAARLATVAADSRTTVLYEAPHRLARTLTDLAAACGPQRRVVIARELTKLHEEIWRGTLTDAAARAAAPAEPLGEHVLVLAGAPDAEPAGEADIDRALADALAAGHDRKSAIALVATRLGVPKRHVYARAIGREP